jgi:hypothetical protein
VPQLVPVAPVVLASDVLVVPPSAVVLLEVPASLPVPVLTCRQARHTIGDASAIARHVR